MHDVQPITQARWTKGGPRNIRMSLLITYRRVRGASTCSLSAIFLCSAERESSYVQPTGPNPLYHRDDEVDRPRAMEFEFPFPSSLTSTFLPEENYIRSDPD